jgi:NADH-quinone oxidoreductase subunit C
MLTNQSVAERLQAKFGSAIVSTDEQFGMLSLTVQRETIYAIMQFLRDDADLQFNFMTDLCGIHYPDNPKPPS